MITNFKGSEAIYILACPICSCFHDNNSLYSVLWIFSSSLNPGTNMFSSSMSLIPKNYTFEHYKFVYGNKVSHLVQE